MTTPTSTTIRLHITPFTPDLLGSVIPASIQPLATDISFHRIPTFPENNYGYVTLPEMEANKIKKKLNGSILKGRKFKVDTAQPQKRQRDDEDDSAAVASVSKSTDKLSKKRKSEDNVLDGYELPSDRQVKRGWTESTSTKKERRREEKMKKKGKDEHKAKTQAKSKYTEKSECLFRTKIPQNRSSSGDEKQEKQSKKKKMSSQETVVHEFAKTITQPSFLRSEGDESAPTSTFEEGKGWIDNTGSIKEPVSDRIQKDQRRPGQVAGAKEKRPARSSLAVKELHTPKAKDKGKPLAEETESTDESEDWTSSSGSASSDDSSTDSESDGSETSDSSGSDVSLDEEEQQQEVEKPSANTTAVPTTVADEDAPSAETNNEPVPKEVHPLEALFKRPAPKHSEDKPAAEENPQFSFFGQNDAESEEEQAQATEPHTPFTKKDLLGRGLRSAAPTPDTALIGRNINWKQTEAMDVDDEPYPNTPVLKPSAGTTDESEFTKWFWENRGDNNRAWKKRRRDAAKEQRQRENRRTGMKGKS